MTDRPDAASQTLPRTLDADLPKTLLLHRLRPPAGFIVRHRWRLEKYDETNVPADGPVILAANHVGWLDGPLLAIASPRPVHALTKTEMFEGRMGQLLLGAGQIPLNRHSVDPRAIRTSLRCLEDGRVLGLFPEGQRGAGDGSRLRRGAAYLAMVSGAPVVPVVFLGTRLRGGSEDSLPPAGSRLTMTFGAPVRLETLAWPRTQQQVAEATERVGEALRATIATAQTRTGLSLPGPIPKDEVA